MIKVCRSSRLIAAVVLWPGFGAADRYRHAIALGVDYVEFDVRRTKDEVMVVCHDGCTASGRALGDFEFGDLSEELGGEALTLEELLDVAAGRTGLHLDLKESGYEERVVQTVLARCPEDMLVITSEDAVVRVIKESHPQVRAGLSLGEDLGGVAPWTYVGVRLREIFPGGRLRRCHADFVAVHRQLARLNVLRYCERNRIPAWVWTVNEGPEIASFLADSRVTALITDRPDLAVQLRSR